MLYKNGDKVKIELIGEIIHVEEDVIINGRKTPYNYEIELSDGRVFKIKGPEVKTIVK